MLRLFLLISILFGSLISTTDVSAFVTYTPGALIAMTGSNRDVRFDVNAVFSVGGPYDTTVPALMRDSQTFTGAFYGSGIGWIIFSTGTYQVSLNCGLQPLSTLTSDCTLTGTGWSENVGDIYFSSGTTVSYNPNTGYLSGSVITFVGGLSLSGIALPLRPIELKEASMIANSGATLTVSGAWMYEGSGSAWKGTKQIGLGSEAITGLNGLYNSVDFSLAAGTYTITIEDPNGSKTEITGFVVNPGTLSDTLDSSSFYAKTFCNTNYATEPIRCPDGATRSATSLIQFPTTTLIANGTDAYNFTFKARDTYGNRIETGSVKIKYITKVKRIQINIGDNPDLFLLPSNLGDGDALISNLIGGLGGIAQKTFGPLLTDPTYNIKSTAPTDITDNRIQLDSITYTSGSTVIPLSFSTVPLIFTPLYTASISAPAPTIGVPHTFRATVTKNDLSSLITPTIINTLKVGGGNLAEWKDLSSLPLETCIRYQGDTSLPHIFCNWDSVLDKKASIATPSSSSFTFTGTYKLISPFPPKIDTNINTYIYYKSGSTDILYSSTPPNTPLSPAVPPTLRLRILGQSGNWTNLGSQTRVDLINTIRKNIALLSRNRTDYTHADHIITTGNKTISNADFSGDKRSIIVVGGDISITSNIIKHNRPIAIIALTDASGNGGNITISGSVRDINSTLIAEHAITSETSSGQLYIYGSVISSNPPQDTAPLTCPYFAPSGCSTPADYDLPSFRSTYDFDPTNTSTGGLGHLTPLVIEIDPRLISDAPPAINK